MHHRPATRESPAEPRLQRIAPDFLAEIVLEHVHPFMGQNVMARDPSRIPGQHDHSRPGSAEKDAVATRHRPPPRRPEHGSAGGQGRAGVQLQPVVGQGGKKPDRGIRVEAEPHAGVLATPDLEADGPERKGDPRKHWPALTGVPYHRCAHRGHLAPEEARSPEPRHRHPAATIGDGAAQGAPGETFLDDPWPSLRYAPAVSAPKSVVALRNTTSPIQERVSHVPSGCGAMD